MIDTNYLGKGQNARKSSVNLGFTLEVFGAELGSLLARIKKSSVSI